MMENKGTDNKAKKVVILGAGKLGRGFAADVFRSGDYEILFADTNPQLVDALNARKTYTLYNIPSVKEEKRVMITGYRAVTTADPSLPEAIREIGLMAVVVFPDAFGSIADLIADVVMKKYECGDATPLNVIVMANIVSPQKRMREEVNLRLSEACRGFAARVLGIVGTVVLRIAVQATAQMLEEDPLTVVTDGYPCLLVEDAFQGKRPESPALEYHKDLDALEVRKIFTYNMAHAVEAYLGFHKGYATIDRALEDPWIEETARGALREVSAGLVKEYGFTEEEMKTHIENVIHKHQNPVLCDTPKRVGQDPIRKLRFSDRMIGAAMMAYRSGCMPEHILKGVAYGFLFSAPDDPAACEITQCVQQFGIEQAIRTYTGLMDEPLIECVKQHYRNATEGREES